MPAISTAGDPSRWSIWAAAPAPTCAPPRRCWGRSSTGPWSTWIRALLEAAVTRLTDWADGADRQQEKLILFKGAKRITVEFRAADLARDLEAALGPNANLVTASALFDLVSAAFISRFAAALAKRKSAFYTVLTYDGDQRWTPEHEADAALLEAFNAHQKHDKGFGPAAGPDAADTLSEAFSAAGYSVEEGDSAWRLEADEAALIADLAAGFADAARRDGRSSTPPRSRAGATSPAPPPSSATPTPWPCRPRDELCQGASRPSRSGIGVSRRPPGRCVRDPSLSWLRSLTMA